MGAINYESIRIRILPGYIFGAIDKKFIKKVVTKYKKYWTFFLIFL
jgi:hypothetical protein